MTAETDMLFLPAQMRDVYNRRGWQFDRERSKSLFEKDWLDRFIAFLPTDGSILDVGCGSAEPIASYCLEQGFQVTGVDFSETMIAMASDRYPEGRWLTMDMRSLQLGMKFNGIISWHSFFHLTRDDQRKVLPLFPAHLCDGGVLMLTVGPKDGECTGRVGGELVYHASLAIEEYTDILAQNGVSVLDFVPEDSGCDGATVLLAQKV